MEQNYSLIVQSRANYYTAGSPVQFVRVELLKGDVTGEVAVCLTFKNVGSEPLTGLVIHFKCKDASGEILCEDDFYYEQLNVQPGAMFGSDDAVYVSDTPVSSVEIEQDRVFLNGRGVDLRGYRRVRLPAQRVLPGSIARTLQSRTGNKELTCVPQDTENGWFCACGAFHPNEENAVQCSECGADRASVKKILTEILEEARSAAERQQREMNAAVDPAAATAAAAQAAINRKVTPVEPPVNSAQSSQSAYAPPMQTPYGAPQNAYAQQPPQTAYASAQPVQNAYMPPQSPQNPYAPPMQTPYAAPPQPVQNAYAPQPPVQNPYAPTQAYPQPQPVPNGYPEDPEAERVRRYAPAGTLFSDEDDGTRAYDEDDTALYDAAAHSSSDPRDRRGRYADEDEQTEDDTMAARIIRWAPPVTAVICAMIIAGALIYHFVVV